MMPETNASKRLGDGFPEPATDLLAASTESLSAYVSQETRRTAPMPAELQGRLAEVLEAHANLPRPWQVGHVISARPLRQAARA